MTRSTPVKPHQHGTTTGYNYGCRCTLCREARNEDARMRRRRADPTLAERQYQRRAAFLHGPHHLGNRLPPSKVRSYAAKDHERPLPGDHFKLTWDNEHEFIFPDTAQAEIVARINAGEIIYTATPWGRFPTHPSPEIVLAVTLQVLYEKPWFQKQVKRITMPTTQQRRQSTSSVAQSRIVRLITIGEQINKIDRLLMDTRTRVMGPALHQQPHTVVYRIEDKFVSAYTAIVNMNRALATLRYTLAA